MEFNEFLITLYTVIMGVYFTLHLSLGPHISWFVALRKGLPEKEVDGRFKVRENRHVMIINKDIKKAYFLFFIYFFINLVYFICIYFFFTSKFLENPLLALIFGIPIFFIPIFLNSTFAIKIKHPHYTDAIKTKKRKDFYYLICFFAFLYPIIMTVILWWPSIKIFICA